MVFAFIIAASSSKKQNIILYSSVFGLLPGIENSDHNQIRLSNVDKSNTPTDMQDSIRDKRRNILHSILDRTKTEFEYNLTLGATSVLGNIQTLVDPYCSPEIEAGGIFSMPLFSTSEPKTVVWHAIQNGCLFILVCDWQENRLLAFRILKKIISSLLERCDTPPEELSKKIYLVSAVVDVFLPAGQLVFLHQQLLSQLNKKLESILKGTSK